LIEECVAIGASDSGIYVGQSEKVIVKGNQARQNVAGIEIENSKFVDVFENIAENNTGGILVFDLPNLPVMGGQHIRVFKNTVKSNNHSNFAPAGNIVALVPPGTGVMVMAMNQVEVFDNLIELHDTISVAIVSYMMTGKKYKDPNYDPFPEGIFVYNNDIKPGGKNPRGKLIEPLLPLFPDGMPDIVWDGLVNPKKLDENGLIAAENRLYLQQEKSTFANIQLDKLLSGKPQVERDISKHAGKLAALKKTELDLSWHK
jgi:parallel beta-helix repeat protein